ncbi:hypothetical protein [Kitasatospora sp. NPDC059571]
MSGGCVGLDRVDALAVVGEEVGVEELTVVEEVEGGVAAGSRGRRGRVR